MDGYNGEELSEYEGQDDAWEEHEEPLYDPMRAEVRGMVREFYEQCEGE